MTILLIEHLMHIGPCETAEIWQPSNTRAHQVSQNCSNHRRVTCPTALPACYFRLEVRVLQAAQRRHFEKCAVVTDTRWVHDAVKLFGVLMPCPVQLYENERLADAKKWISQ